MEGVPDLNDHIGVSFLFIDELLLTFNFFGETFLPDLRKVTPGQDL